MDLRKKGEKTYCDGGSSGRALWNSGANRLMQRPTTKQRRGSKMTAVLECWVIERKKKR